MVWACTEERQWIYWTKDVKYVELPSSRRRRKA